jgi:glucose/mannose-6-phosphate isomerase
MSYREEIDSISDQFSIQEKFKITLDDYDKILIAGMGGSGIAGFLFSEIYSKKPVIVLNTYSCPDFVNNKTLFIAISYSGNTEETISCANEAKKKGAKILAITSGGKLSEISDQSVIIPSGYQPRSSLGFLLMPLINTFAPELRNHIDEIKRNIEEIKNNENYIISISKRILESGKVPYFISWNPTSSVAYRCKTQFNENAKMPANAGYLSEINHNELVPMGMNHDMDPFIYIAFKNSFSKRNDKRLEITKELSSRNFTIIELKGKSIFSQIMYGVYFGDILSYQIALLRKVEPRDVSIIEKLKQELSS